MNEERHASASWAGGMVPEVSVIVPTHDRAAYLGELVAALEAQTFPASRFEVLIVDDASSDATWSALHEIAARTPARLLAARLSANAGPAAARNHAVSLARGARLAFTDDDCLPDAGWLSEIVDGLRTTDVVQGRTLPVPAELGSAGPWARTVWITRRSDLFETCNIGWMREAFDRVGGFEAARPDSPARTRAHFGEDAELGWRLLSSGGTFAFRPGALVHHRVHPGSFVDWLGERRRLGLFPSLVRRAPGLRKALRLGLFLSSDTAAFDLAIAGGVVAAFLRNPWPLLAALPWLALRWRQAGDRPGRPRPVRVAQLAIGDAVGLAALVAGSVRAGRPVL
ncbi:MAG: glycosyltransferase [Actinomycetota bacterium]